MASRRSARRSGDLVSYTSRLKAKPTVVDSIRFASKGEAKRYAELKLLQRAGVISGLTPHPKYDLIVNNIKIGTYTADFKYTENGEEVIEDYKPKKKRKDLTDRIFYMKRQLMLAVHNIEVRET